MKFARPKTLCKVRTSYVTEIRGVIPELELRTEEHANCVHAMSDRTRVDACFVCAWRYNTHRPTQGFWGRRACVYCSKLCNRLKNIWRANYMHKLGSQWHYEHDRVSGKWRGAMGGGGFAFPIYCQTDPQRIQWVWYFVFLQNSEYWRRESCSFPANWTLERRLFGGCSTGQCPHKRPQLLGCCMVDTVFHSFQSHTRNFILKTMTFSVMKPRVQKTTNGKVCTGASCCGRNCMNYLLMAALKQLKTIYSCLDTRSVTMCFGPTGPSSEQQLKADLCNPIISRQIKYY